MPKAIDPVCKMEVDTQDAPAEATYKDKTYYFCMESCKKVFNKNPEKYIGAGSTDTSCCDGGSCKT